MKILLLFCFILFVESIDPNQFSNKNITWAVFGDIIGWDGGTTNNTGGNNGTQRTILCQFDANNFILFSGHGVLKNVANMLKSENGCKYAVNLDGGGSRKMYYKTNAQATLTKRYGGSRLIPDLLYFVEQ